MDIKSPGAVTAQLSKSGSENGYSRIATHLPVGKLIKNFEDFQIGEGDKKGAPW
jgi:hypothetical protein